MGYHPTGEILIKRTVLMILLIPIVMGGQIHYRGQILTSGQWQSVSNHLSVFSRYYPDILWRTDSDWGFADLDLSYRFNISNQNSAWKFDGSWYRAQFRIGGNSWDLRGGLQQLNFGPGKYLRSLRWFDTLDPRDPLQLTTGVIGVRFKAYSQRTTTQVWVLENTSSLRGWEWIPGSGNAPELGGRFLMTAGGDMGLTVHTRSIRIDPNLGDGSSDSGREWRFALDGMWDIGPGVWFEGVLTHRNLSEFSSWNQETSFSIGMDYTFPIGQGITTTVEFLDARLGTISNSVRNNQFSAVEVRLPLTITDQLSWVVFSDIHSGLTISTLSWQRILDAWILYVAWVSHSQVASTRFNNTGLGDGLTLLLVFNH